MSWASSGGRSTSLGHVARGGVSAQAPPSASPLLLPSLVAPLPLPPLYFYSLNSAESSAFYSSDSPPTHTHVHTHVHTPLHTYTHLYKHSYKHTSTHTPAHTPLHTHLCGQAQTWGVQFRGPHSSGPDAHSASPTALPHPLLAFAFRAGAWQGRFIRNFYHRDVIPTMHGNHLWSLMKTANPQVTPLKCFSSCSGHALPQPG